MAIPITTLSSLLRRLERCGHVRRLPHQSDGRSHRIDLTDAGRAAHLQASERCLPVLLQVEDALSQPPGQQRAALRELERTLRQAGGLPAPVSRALPTPAISSLFRGGFPQPSTGGRHDLQS
jgi:DNA-binding MarR family transcriptional regulator